MKVLCLMEISKEGLSEEELKAILHIDSGTWSPIFFAMASFILDRAGLYRYNVPIEIVLYLLIVLYYFVNLFDVKLLHRSLRLLILLSLLSYYLLAGEGRRCPLLHSFFSHQRHFSFRFFTP